MLGLKRTRDRAVSFLPCSGMLRRVQFQRHRQRRQHDTGSWAAPLVRRELHSGLVQHGPGRRGRALRTGRLTRDQRWSTSGRPGRAHRGRGELLRGPPRHAGLLERLVVDEDRIEYHWTFTGTNTGPGGTGNAVRVDGFEAWTIDEDGLIATSIGSYDPGSTRASWPKVSRGPSDPMWELRQAGSIRCGQRVLSTRRRSAGPTCLHGV